MESQSLVERALNPFEWYRSKREQTPVYFDQTSRMWSVFRYNDVLRALSEHATFSSQFIGSSQPLDTSLINTDPPRHRQLRSLVTQAFTPRTVAQLTPRITEIVNELLDKVAPTGKMDIMGDFATPLPVTVIAELLGVPLEDRARFKHWSDQIVGAAEERGGNPQAEMGQYFYHMLEQRRKKPQNDLMSALLAAQIDGEHLSTHELLGFCILLLVAGNETTTHLITNAIRCFDDNPGTGEQLRAEPALIPDAIEEVLRYRSPVKLMFRICTKDTMIGESKIGEGQPVIAWIGSANHDEAQFPNAEQFDIRRSPNRHIAFGHGIHFCLGAPLARLEAKIAFEAMLQRFSHIQVVRDVPLEPTNSFILHGVKHLPVTFEQL